MLITKDYLGSEQQRNKKYAVLYTEMLQMAYGTENAVLIGHHICFEHNNEIETENEIPAADTLIFDHDLMKRIFGSMFRIVLRDCADVPCTERDEVLLKHFTCEKRQRELRAMQSTYAAPQTLQSLDV